MNSLNNSSVDTRARIGIRRAEREEEVRINVFEVGKVSVDLLEAGVALGLTDRRVVVFFFERNRVAIAKRSFGATSRSQRARCSKFFGNLLNDDSLQRCLAARQNYLNGWKKTKSNLIMKSEISHLPNRLAELLGKSF